MNNSALRLYALLAILDPAIFKFPIVQPPHAHQFRDDRSEEHTSELQSLMRISYAVFCLKKKNKKSIKNYRQVCTIIKMIKNKNYNTKRQYRERQNKNV